jgi:hypothetical protein
MLESNNCADGARASRASPSAAMRSAAGAPLDLLPHEQRGQRESGGDRWLVPGLASWSWRCSPWRCSFPSTTSAPRSSRCFRRSPRRNRRPKPPT